MELPCKIRSCKNIWRGNNSYCEWYASCSSYSFVLRYYNPLTEIISNNAAVVLYCSHCYFCCYGTSLRSVAICALYYVCCFHEFLTPVGYQTNTMVYGSANYRFSDFFWVGAPPIFFWLLSLHFYLVVVVIGKKHSSRYSREKSVFWRNEEQIRKRELLGSHFPCNRTL